MTKKLRKRRSFYRVFADDEGSAFLKLEPAGITVKLKRPVTAKNLEAAKAEAMRLRLDQLEAEVTQISEATDPRRIEAQKEIEVALNPMRKGPWLSRFDYTASHLKLHIITVLGSLVLIALAYKGVQASSERLPVWLHAVVLVLYVLALARLLSIIGTEENRLKYHKAVNVWLGPRGMLVLPCFLLVTAGAVLASITFRLYNRGSISLETCSGRAVTEAGLLDFFMWHFVNIVPTLQLTKLWRWGEPYCYTQSRVGLLIFVFQLLVVIPSFNTVRFYWKHRKSPPEYVYDPNWNPDPE